jgi:hypothetical protein
MQRSGPIRLPVLEVVGILLVQGCGPSVQTIYEGNLRFEHCYRLDLDTAKAPSHRHACWQNWLQIYTYSQPRDRIEYARRRVRSIEAGDRDRPLLKLQNDHDPTERQWYLSRTAPVNAHAPPPAMVEGWDGGTKARTASTGTSWTESDADSGAAPPEASCSAACREGWQSCLKPCTPSAAKTIAPTCAHCEPDYLACMRRCFR